MKKKLNSFWWVGYSCPVTDSNATTTKYFSKDIVKIRDYCGSAFILISDENLVCKGKKKIV